jgi:uncharacterized protein YlzI (FlbEa/FlbD family)
MKFIKLTKLEGGEIHISSMLITALEPDSAGTTVHLMGSKSHVVTEKVESIKKKIDTFEIRYKNESKSASSDL